MAIIRCKMCGGELTLSGDQSVAQCEYCGSIQTVPVLDDERKLAQFDRAERLRKQCEFDKAAGIYEAILADYAQEAEAYWGLVLCRFGIEYVDDPATGKKVPTCHRSSFENVLEDQDLEQALENADLNARRVYREEAKRIEELRRGIVAVSASEEPFDIFICYKETDEKGQRTLDSVLAQDIYDALTGKGYRVFFSRITLEDKLGIEYEPYIFAALNSARVMLAVGTDYEYYNAVWVKNEWSRYLKLMAKDRSRYLIPCYKGLDAYDMPREFAKLQAQDMGKVGAMQDLLRGIEKLLPREQAVPALQEAAVGGSRISSLLDRGFMALEDGEWEKADGFFEDVLNNESKNPRAYLGKTLAMAKCRDMDAFVAKRREATAPARSQRLQLEPDKAHVDAMVEKCTLPNYVTADRIRPLYVFDLSYTSEVEARKQQLATEERHWTDHKLLSRARRYATGELARLLEEKQQALFDVMRGRLEKARADQAEAESQLRRRYSEFLARKDEQAQAILREGQERREADYQELKRMAESCRDIARLNEAPRMAAKLGGYRDTQSLVEQCAGNAEREAARLRAEMEQQRLRQEQLEKARKAKATRTGIIVAAVVVLLIAAALVLTKVVIPSNNYNKATELLESGSYAEAADAFGAFSGYQDSGQQREYARARLFMECARTGDETQEALLKEYGVGTTPEQGVAYASDSRSEVDRIWPAKAKRFVLTDRYLEAAELILTDLGDLRDCSLLLQELDEIREEVYSAQYAQAEALQEQEEYLEAARAFSALGSYRDVDDRLAWIHGLRLMEARCYSEARDHFSGMGSYPGSAEMAKEAEYQRLCALYELCDSLHLMDEVIMLPVGVSGEPAVDISVDTYQIICPEEDVSEYSGWRVSGVCDFYQPPFSSEPDFLEELARLLGQEDLELEIYSLAGNWSLEAAYDQIGMDWGQTFEDHLDSGFKALGDYRDAATFLGSRLELRYEEAMGLAAAGRYDEALTALAALSDRMDVAEALQSTWYAKGEALLAKKDYSGAVAAYLAAGNYKDAPQKVRDNQLKDCQIGATVILGSYEQDNDQSNGKEPIEWVVVAEKEGQVLLLSKYCLDYRPFNNAKSNSWGGCSLRTWLNGSFYNGAFSGQEKGLIQSTRNQYYTDRYSTEKVFLLSQSEATACSTDIRKAVATPWAVAQGARGGQYISWWLRTQDYNIHYVKRMGSDGVTGGYGEVYDWSSVPKYSSSGVRPAIWIKCG